MIYLLYCKFDKPVSSKHWSNYLNLLNSDLRKKALSYHRWEDRQAFVFGKILLLNGLSRYGFNKDVLSKIKYTEYGKPFLEENIGFNISHCANSGIVVCAIGENIELGVDVEAIENINFSDFKNVMTESQWQYIISFNNPIESFFSLWTMKESVIKADGRGMSIPLLDIQIHNNKVEYENKIWHLRKLFFGQNTCACLATSLPKIPIQYIKVDFDI